MLLSYQELVGDVGPKSDGSIIEDLRDFVENVSAIDRPALAMLRKSRVRTHYVEWNTDTLAARGDNAWTEGVTHTDQAITVPTRSTASVQIFAKFGQVSDVQRAIEHVGMEDAFLYHERKKVAEVLNDMEHAIHRGSMVTGASGTARRMAGLLNIISTNTTVSTGTTLTEDVFGDFLQLFTDGGTEIRPSVCFGNSYVKRTISHYSTRVTRNIDATAREQLLTVDAYESDFGRVNVFYSRDQLKSASKTTAGNTFVIIDPRFFELGFLQNLQSETLARDGLSTKFQISAMMTLIYRSELAGASGKQYAANIPTG